METIKKEVLIDDMPGLYAVGQVTVGGKVYYAAASENRNGKVFLVDPRTSKCHEIEGGQGGVMAVIPDTDGVMLFIEEFYPVFDSATAKVIAVELKTNDTGDLLPQPERTEAAQVPYVHRIGLLEEADGRFLAVGKLCKHKEFPDDWSTSGTLEIAPYNGKKAGAFDLVRDGVNKHHAMFIFRNAEGYDDLFYGGTEGVFRTVRKDGQWVTEKLLDVPVSDIVYHDLDGDGVPELAVIEQFHGDNVAVFKLTEGQYIRQIDIPVTFGHVLWGGSFLGEPGLIAGSRGGDKKLILYRFGQGDGGRLVIREETEIDEGQAPAQIFVIEGTDTTEVISANHGAAQLVRYRFKR